MAKGLQGDQAIAVRDCDGGGGEGALLDRLTQQGEGGAEGFVLLVEGSDGSQNVVQGLRARWGIGS